MYGRVTWYKGPPEKADEGIQAFKDLLPKIQQLPGYSGGALMVDRDAGEALTIVYYRDRSALDESRAIVKQMREAIQQQQREDVTRIEEYEITTMERAQPGTTGTWCRVITGTTQPSKLDQGVALVNRDALPILKRQKGWRAFVGGVNRQSGAAITGTTFDTREQLEASNAPLTAFRDELQKILDLKDRKSQVFEIVVADVAATATLRV